MEKQLPIWVARAGQFGWRSAMSLNLVWPLESAYVRVVTIPISSAKVRNTCTKTGSKIIGIDIGISLPATVGADR